MEGRGLCIGGKAGPCLGIENHTGFNGFGHKLCTLGVDLTAAKSIVSHLGVAHVLIAGQTDGSTVGFQIGMGAGGKQMVKGRGIGNLHSIAAAAVTQTDAVHNHQYNRLFHSLYPPFGKIVSVLYNRF